MSLRVSDQVSARFERGFKTWAENTSLALRSRLHLAAVDPLPPSTLASHLGVRLWAPHDVPGLSTEALTHLSTTAADEWSAVSVRVGQLDIVVVNTSHSPARQSSDIMHEPLHIIRGHAPAQVHMSIEIGIAVRSFNSLQEAEADWLAGCLLLPRSALAGHVPPGRCRSMKRARSIR